MMTTQITIDRAGRVVIPKQVRDAFALAPGDTLDLETAGESISLRPVRATLPLTKEKGVWVFRLGLPLDIRKTANALDEVRAERDLQNFGAEI